MWEENHKRILLYICFLKYLSINQQFRVWARPEAVENTRYALQAGVDILSYFEEYFDFDYPLEKQG